MTNPRSDDRLSHRTLIVGTTLLSLICISGGTARLVGQSEGGSRSVPWLVHPVATSAIAVTKTVVAQGAFPGDGKRISMDDPLAIHNWILDFAPYGQLGWHMHPGPVVVTVTQGTLTKFETNGCSHMYHAGETFEEPPFKGHNLVETSGGTAQTVAVSFIPSGQAVRIDLPAPIVSLLAARATCS